MKRPTIIAVDFDGVIVENRFPAIGTEIKGAISTLSALQKIGCKLILWSCRTGEHLDAAVQWCANRGLRFDAINTNIEGVDYGLPKVVATLYLDDHNIERMCSGLRDYTSDDWLEVKATVASMTINGVQGKFDAATA